MAELGMSFVRRLAAPIDRDMICDSLSEVFARPNSYEGQLVWVRDLNSDTPNPGFYVKTTNPPFYWERLTQFLNPLGLTLPIADARYVQQADAFTEADADQLYVKQADAFTEADADQVYHRQDALHATVGSISIDGRATAPFGGEVRADSVQASSFGPNPVPGGNVGISAQGHIVLNAGYTLGVGQTDTSKNIIIGSETIFQNGTRTATITGLDGGDLIVGAGGASNVVYMSSHVRFQDGATIYGTQAVTSDDRLKHDETPLTDGLEVVRQLAPQRYTQTDTFDADPATGRTSVGFIAQEVQTIPQLTHAVHTADDRYSLSYNDLFTYTTRAVQELDALVQQQAAQIAELSARLAAVEVF